MRAIVISLVAAIGCFAVAANPTSAKAQVLECPELADLKTPQLASEIWALLPKGLALSQPDQLQAAIWLLREHGMSADNTINHLVALYCPAVSAEAGLSHAQKMEDVRQFAQLVSAQVSADACVEDIIISVPLPPGIAEAASARQQGESPGRVVDREDR